MGAFKVTFFHEIKELNKLKAYSFSLLLKLNGSKQVKSSQRDLLLRFLKLYDMEKNKYMATNSVVPF